MSQVEGGSHFIRAQDALKPPRLSAVGARKIGFTGTKQGMTVEQRRGVAGVVLALTRRVDELFGRVEGHHGDCTGADEQMDLILRALDCRRVVHPPEIDQHRAFCKGDQNFPARPYLERNHDIVDATEVMIAAPRGYTEEQRSGTWATIRYARKQGRTIYIVWPNGEVEVESGPNHQFTNPYDKQQ